MRKMRSLPFGSAMHFSGYGYSWRIFSWFGIEINKSPRKQDCKNLLHMLLQFPFVMFVSSSVYTTILLIRTLYVVRMEVRAVAPSLVVCLLSNVLWILMYKRRTSIRTCLIKVAVYSTKHQFELLARSTFNLIVGAFFAVQVAYVLVAVYILNAFPREGLEVWTLGYHVEHGTWWNVLMFFCNAAYVLQTTTFPGFVTILMCGMFSQLSSSIRSYGRKLKDFADSNDDTLVTFVGEYSKLVGLVRKANAVLSTPTLVVFAMHLLIMFNSVATFLMMREEDLLESFIGENVFLLASASCSMLSMSVCASNVHLEAQAVSSALKDLHERELKLSKLSSRQLCLIRAIAERDVVAISACGMLNFKREYILSVLGGYVTYTLLFISIKKE